MTEDYETQLDKLVESTELSRSEAEDRVEEKFQELKEKKSAAISEDQLRKYAVSVLQNSDTIKENSGGFGGGDTEELPLLTLGYEVRRGDKFVTQDDGDAIVGSGIVSPEEDPAGFFVAVLDTSDGLDMEFIQEAFEPLNTLRAGLSRRQVGSWDGEPKLKKGGYPVYILNSTEESVIELVDPDSVDDSDPISELPSGIEEKRELINDRFITEDDEMTVETYAEHESITNDNGFPLAFGADVKRIRASVVDSIIFDPREERDFPSGSMTVVDDTVFDSDDVPEELVTDSMRTPGLRINSAEKLTYGEDSLLDLYGYVQQYDSGQYVFQAYGVVPIIEFDYDGPDYNESAGSDAHATEDTL